VIGNEAENDNDEKKKKKNDDGNNNNELIKSNAATLWTDAQIQTEMKILQRNWSATPFRFILRQVVRTYNDEWSNFDINRSEDFDDEVVAKLRIGGRTTLNIFINDGSCTRDPATGVLGGQAIHDFNDLLWPDDTFSRRDFISMCSQIIHSYNENLLTHEIGHWFG